jgi:hypothetical protein
MITPGHYTNGKNDIYLNLKEDGSYSLIGIPGMDTPDGRYAIESSVIHRGALSLKLNASPGLPFNNAILHLPITIINQVSFSIQDRFLGEDFDGDPVKIVFTKITA